MCDLPHRCLIAVLTLSEVLVYDTHHTAPICAAAHLHYAPLTDATWSADGRYFDPTSTHL
jgi:chromatin assembly factor 1 subunit B